MSAPAPRFAPKRDTALATEGGEIAALSKLFGKPLMPHQRQIVDIGTERRADGSGYKYKYVIITLPRQSGKTTLMTPVQLHRLIKHANLSAFFTAQNGVKAKARFMDTVKLVRESPLASYFAPRLAQGSEQIATGNGSTLKLFPPTEEALHGETPHLVTMDEIWSHSALKGQQLLGAIGPSQITLGNEAQIWMISTMGTAESGMLNEWITRGRAGEPGVAYFEWSLAPGLDAHDPANWGFHPALGHTITLADLESEHATQPLATWERAYMNRATAADDPLYPPEVWNALADPELSAQRAEVSVAYEVAADNSSAAVVAGWYDEAGRPCVRVVHSAPGTTWLAPLVRRIRDEWRPVAIGADDGGTTRRVTDELTRDGVEVTTTGFRDFATACDALLVAVDDARLRHDGSETFTQELTAAVVHSTGEARKLSRKHSAGPIPALIAAAVALWNHSHQPTYSKAVFR